MPLERSKAPLCYQQDIGQSLDKILTLWFLHINIIHKQAVEMRNLLKFTRPDTL